MKKTLAALLTLSLVLLSPGLASYAAAADIMRGGVPAAAPIAGAAIGREPAVPSLASPLAAPSLELPSAAAPGVSAPAGAAPVSGEAAAAAGVEAAAKDLAPQLEAVSAPASADADAAGAARNAQEILLGGRVRMPGALAVEAANDPQGGRSLLSPAGAPKSSASSRAPQPPKPSTNGDGPRGSSSKPLGFVAMLARMAAVGGAVYGLQTAAVALAPTVFGLVPFAAVWAIAAGVAFIPAAAYARYRLYLHDSPRLKKVKWLLDAAVGAYLGAVAVAYVGGAFAATLAGPAAAVLPLVGLAGVGTTIGVFSGVRLVDVVLGGGVLFGVPALLGAGAAGLIGVAPMIGMMALPAMTTVAFFLVQLIHSAETGAPFSGLGTLRKFRFPSFNWLMTGVVFALTTGYSAVWSNVAFGVWTLFGETGMPTWDRKAPLQKNLMGLATNFNLHYFALLAYTAATGFSSPLTFLVLAFAPERAAMWTEMLLARFLPASAASPSTRPEKLASGPSFDETMERQWPRTYHWAKTFVILGLEVAAVMGLAHVVGIASMWKTAAFVFVMVGAQFWFSGELVEKVMGAKPTTRDQSPVFFRVMSTLRERINKELVAKSKTPIPMPKMVRVTGSMGAGPNAFATGRSPYHATVGVTEGMEDMVLNPENLRESLVRLLGSQTADADSYKIFRIALVGTIPGVTLSSTPQDAAQAVMRADKPQLEALGERLLTGVLGHEFSHVMDRHMVTGSVGAALNSLVSFVSYGFLWTVGHAKALASRVVFGKPLPQRHDDGRRMLFDPISAGAVASLPFLVKVSAFLWGPLAMNLVQLMGTRNNEAQADEDGARLTQDPAALALALGLLMTWRPRKLQLNAMDLPRLNAAAPIMTVNPLKQLQDAGAMPAGNPFELTFGPGDGFLQNLFIDHPDTTLRILTLLKFAQALGHDQNPPQSNPPPPSGGGGSQAPPLAFQQPAPEKTPAESRGSSLGARLFGAVRSAWAKPVLPDPARNSAFWKLTWANALIMIGQQFHYSSLSKLLAPRPELQNRVAENRALNSGSQLVANLAFGPALDAVPVTPMLIFTHVGRAILMFSVPLLFFHGLYFVAAFNIAIFLAGMLQAVGMNAGYMAFTRVLGPDESYYNRANAVFNLVLNVVGVAAPLAAGAFIVAVDAHLGPLSGNALSYAVYGILLLGAAVLFGTAKIPRDALVQAQRELSAALKGVAGVRGVRVGRVLAGPRKGSPVLLVDVDEPATQAGVPAVFSGLPVVVQKREGRWVQLADGFRKIWGDRFLKLNLLFSTFSLMLADPIVFSALPRYIAQLPGLSEAQQGAAFSWYLAASSIGAGLASAAMMLSKDKPALAWSKALERLRAAEPLEAQAAETAREAVLADYAGRWRDDPAFDPLPGFGVALLDAARRARGKPLAAPAVDAVLSWAREQGPAALAEARREALTGMTRLERQGRWSSIMHGVGWLLYLGVFFTSSLPVSVACMGAALLLQGPGTAIWSSLQQKVLSDRLPEAMGKVFSAISFYQLAFAVAGSLLFGWMMAHFATAATLYVAAAVIVLMALADFRVPFAIWRRR